MEGSNFKGIGLLPDGELRGVYFDILSFPHSSLLRGVNVREH